jgi:Pyridoxamine 5'-phosphate oxidase
VTGSLPPEIQAVFDRFVTTEYTTLDAAGQPITWPVTPYYSPGDGCIDVTTGLGYPKKADDAQANPKVSLLFSDPTGSGLERPPMVLVQGTADVDDRDLDANRERYARESVAKLPATKDMHPPAFLQRFLAWYYTRIYVHVRPERIYVWPECDASREPELFDAHLEEVRSGHVEEPETPPPHATGGTISWEAPELAAVGTKHRTGVLAFVSPDGFPFSVRAPVKADRDRNRIRIESEPVGVPLQEGRACLAVHQHAPDFTWQRNFHLRGELVEHDDGWALVPQKLVGGFEVPESRLDMLRANLGKSMRFRRIAKRELERRGTRR